MLHNLLVEDFIIVIRGCVGYRITIRDIYCRLRNDAAMRGKSDIRATLPRTGQSASSFRRLLFLISFNRASLTHKSSEPRVFFSLPRSHYPGIAAAAAWVSNFADRSRRGEEVNVRESIPQRWISTFRDSLSRQNGLSRNVHRAADITRHYGADRVTLWLSRKEPKVRLLSSSLHSRRAAL